MPEIYDPPPTVAKRSALEYLRAVTRETAPIELIIYWCPTCNSTFIHNVGTRHIPQRMESGNHICEGTLIPLQFVR